MRWRLVVEKEPRPAAQNMAIDYLLARSCVDPVLRFYRWSPAAVSIGRFQSLQAEVDTDYCQKHGVDVVRRVTGGGAVFHDDELTYSICIPQDGRLVPSGIIESYKVLCAPVIKGLEQLGIHAEFKGINDLVCGGKKISGCAQTRMEGTILQHGTLLLNVDVKQMFRVLRVCDEKWSDKAIAQVEDRVTSIHQQCGRSIPFVDLVEALCAGFTEFFQADFTRQDMTSQEISQAREFEQSMFDNPIWTARR